MNTFIAYINDSITELRQVRWPTRQQAIRLSAIVLTFTAICAVIFGLLDIGLSELLKFLLSNI